MKKVFNLVLVLGVLFGGLLLSGCEFQNLNVKFWVDGSVYKTIKIKEGQTTLTLPDDPVKAYYTFDGWYLDDGVWEEPFTVELLPQLLESKKLDVYAKWEANPDDANINYGIFVKNDNGDYYAKVSNTTTNFNFKQQISTRKGVNWEISKNSDMSHKISSKVVDLQVGENVFYVKFSSKYHQKETLKFVVKRREIFTVTFNPDDGSDITTIEVEEDSYVIQIPELSKPNYIFGGWGYDFTQPITENLNLTPVWNAIFTREEGVITGLTEYGKTLRSIDIPEVLDGVTITSIGDEAFKDSTFVAVTIPKTITAIGRCAFINSKVNGVLYKGTISQWINIDFVDITSNPLHCEYSKLVIDMEYVSSVEIPNNVEHIKPFVFAKYDFLGTLSFEDGSILKTIGERAFLDTHIQYVDLPKSVISIGDGAFVTRALEGISFEPNSQLKVIGEDAFNDTSLRAIYIPASVETIGKNAFAYCDNLTRVVFEENANIKTVGDGIFLQCENLQEVEFGLNSKLETIGSYAFYYCRNLNAIHLPKTLKSISSGAFDSCSNWYNILYGGTQEDWNKISFENVSANPVLCGGILSFADTEEE